MASVQFIGTATLLIRCGGFTVLTDPNFIRRGESLRMGYLMHATRLTEPALRIEDLPALDVVVVSHIHQDHFDTVARHRLDRSLPIISTPQGAGVLRRYGFRNTHALRPWQSIEFWKHGDTLRVTAAPAVHARGLLAALFPSVMGSVFDFEPAGGPRTRIYTTGDTLLTDDVLHVAERFPDIDVAFLHLGGGRFGPFQVTMDAGQGVVLMRRLRARQTVPIHFNGYARMKDPIDHFIGAVNVTGFRLRDGLKYLAPGATLEIA